MLDRGEEFHGVHHLAVGIAPADFELARVWLSGRVELISVDGSEVIDGPEGWDSRSLYFLGPEDIVLEYIARQAHAHLPASAGQAPRPLSLSEVGIAVPDVQGTVGDLHRVLGLPPFPPQESRFAPVGDHDGLIILVDHERVWFPTDGQQAAHGPVRVQLTGTPPGQLSLRKSADVFAYWEGGAVSEPAQRSMEPLRGVHPPIRAHASGLVRPWWRRPVRQPFSGNAAAQQGCARTAVPTGLSELDSRMGQSSGTLIVAPVK